MNPTIEATFQKIPGDVLKILFRACEDFSCDEPLLELGEFEVRELCHALGNECRAAEEASGQKAMALERLRSRFVWINGWQSWSFAGEIAGMERPRRAFYKRVLNVFVDHPAEVALRQRARRFLHRHDIISHFMLGLRSGDLRLALVSDNVARYMGTSAIGAAGVGRASGTASSGSATDEKADDSAVSGARLVDTFGASSYLPPISFLLRGSKIRIFAYAEGGNFRRGQIVARVAVLIAPGYFALKDKVAGLWGAHGRFEGLRWLSSEAQSAKGAGFEGGGASSGSRAGQGSEEPAHPFHGVIGGYASWYNHYTAIDERIIGADLASIGANNNIVNNYFIRRGRPTVFQIDDGWELAIGDWEAHPEKFPSGMAALACRIRDKNLIPGLWLAPFLLMPDSKTAKAHPEWILRDKDGAPVRAGWNPNWGGDVWCLDLSLPEVEANLTSLFDMVVNEWGYRYLKLDFLYAGLMRGAFAGRKGGAWEHYARIMARILEFSIAADGSPVAFLSCGAPIESTAPFMPLMRSGADTREHWEWPQLRLIGHQGRPSAKLNMQDSIGRAILDKTLLLCDPDVIFCRTERTSLKDTEKFLVGMVAAMFGSQIMSSDDPAGFGRVPPQSGQLSEAEFTNQILDWYQRIESKEFGVERSSLRVREVYRFFSRDKAVYGMINLSDREQFSDGAPVPKHSMLIFGA
ncbi:MAG: glycoside hydrolase family 36 protein [Rectinema subterraneum]|jgi:alpha-galactosidase